MESLDDVLKQASAIEQARGANRALARSGSWPMYKHSVFVLGESRLRLDQSHVLGQAAGTPN